MKLDTAYKVTKGNTDGSVLTGDVIFIDGKDGALVVPMANGWFEKNEQTQSVMDFECEIDSAWEIIRTQNNVLVKRE